MALLDALREMAGENARSTGGLAEEGAWRRPRRRPARRLTAGLLGLVLAGGLLAPVAVVAAGAAPAAAATISYPQVVVDGASAFVYADGQTSAEQVNLSTGTITYLAADSFGLVRDTVNSSGALTGGTSYGALSIPPAIGAPAAAAPWYDYRAYCCLTGGSEAVFYNFSANMAQDMEKAVSKVADKLGNVSKWIAALAGILYGIIHSHPRVAAIIAIVNGVLAAVSMSLPKLANIIKVILKGKGKHTGFYVYDFWNIITGKRYYEKYAARSCASSAYSCGAGGPQI
jgi:hypothetical protein